MISTPPRAATTRCAATVVQVWVKRDGQGRVAATGFEARGCKLSVASADLMADAVAGADHARVRALFGTFERLVTTGSCPDCDAAFADTMADTGTAWRGAFLSVAHPLHHITLERIDGGSRRIWHGEWGHIE